MIERVYDWFAAGPSPECDRALAAGLEHAEPAYRGRIVETLLARRNACAWSILIGRFATLESAERAALFAERAALRDGLSIAVRTGATADRLSALNVLEESGDPRMAYVLAESLHDRTRDVRSRAVQVLHAIAARVADQAPLGPDASADARRAWQTDRDDVAEALDEALRLFDRHYGIELVQAALWFMPELGERVWDVIEDKPRMRLLLLDHLPSWNHPRLAGFLMRALTHPHLRTAALTLLKGWRSRMEMEALLAHGAALRNPDVRRALGLLKQPAWLNTLVADLEQMPPALQPAAPALVSVLGIGDAARMSLLWGWVRAGSPALRRAAVYALASLPAREVAARMTEVARDSDPVGTFAGWYLGGVRSRDAGAEAAEATP
jgi:HEAT repeat protein